MPGLVARSHLKKDKNNKKNDNRKTCVYCLVNTGEN